MLSRRNAVKTSFEEVVMMVSKLNKKGNQEVMPKRDSTPVRMNQVE